MVFVFLLLVVVGGVFVVESYEEILVEFFVLFFGEEEMSFVLCMLCWFFGKLLVFELLELIEELNEFIFCM